MEALCIRPPGNACGYSPSRVQQETWATVALYVNNGMEIISQYGSMGTIAGLRETRAKNENMPSVMRIENAGDLTEMLKSGTLDKVFHRALQTTAGQVSGSTDPVQHDVIVLKGIAETLGTKAGLLNKGGRQVVCSYRRQFLRFVILLKEFLRGEQAARERAARERPARKHAAGSPNQKEEGGGGGAKEQASKKKKKRKKKRKNNAPQSEGTDVDRAVAELEAEELRQALENKREAEQAAKTERAVHNWTRLTQQYARAIAKTRFNVHASILPVVLKETKPEFDKLQAQKKEAQRHQEELRKMRAQQAQARVDREIEALRRQQQRQQQPQQPQPQGGGGGSKNMAPRKKLPAKERRAHRRQEQISRAMNNKGKISSTAARAAAKERKQQDDAMKTAAFRLAKKQRQVRSMMPRNNRLAKQREKELRDLEAMKAELQQQQKKTNKEQTRKKHK